MPSKKVNFGTKPQKQPDVDAWVESRDAPADKTATELPAIKEQALGTSSKTKAKAQSVVVDKPDKDTLKRLTLDIPEALHRRIKGRAVMEGVTMVNMLRELLEETYK
jgi:predicted DNA binding CopG/RHH family protein